MALSFQNCQRAKIATTGSVSTVQNNAYVYEGKLYINEPDLTCADGKKGKAAILYFGVSQATKTRQNCQDLNPPLELAAGDFALESGNPNNLIHSGEVFIADSTSNPIARIQGAEVVRFQGSMGSITTSAFNTALTGGNLVACALIYYSPFIPNPVSAVTDSAGNAFTRAGNANNGQGRLNGYAAEIWFKENITAAPAGTTVTATSPNVALNALHCFEYSGLATSGALDQSLSNRGTSTGTNSVAIGSPNVSSTRQLVFMAIFSSNGIPAQAPGFQAATTMAGDSVLDQLVNVAGPLAVQASVTDDWTANLVSFRSAP